MSDQFPPPADPQSPTPPDPAFGAAPIGADPLAADPLSPYQANPGENPAFSTSYEAPPAPPAYSGPPTTPYQAPPPGYQAPPAGYGAPAFQPGAPTGAQSYSTAAMSHWVALLVCIFAGGTLGWIPPLIFWNSNKFSDPFVAEHAKESLNFQITVAIAMVASWILAFVFIGFLTMLAVMILTLIWTIQASGAANRGQLYRYPVSIRFVK